MSEGQAREFDLAVGPSTMLEPSKLEYLESGGTEESDQQSSWADVKPASETPQLCRLCANTADYLIPIFEGQGREHKLDEKMSKHLPIQIKETDELPLELCYQCASTLIAWDTLLSTCLEADRKLKALLLESKKTAKTETNDDAMSVGDVGGGDPDDIDSDDEPLITSRNKLISNQVKSSPIKKKILSKTKRSTGRSNKTAASKEGDSERCALLNKTSPPDDADEASQHQMYQCTECLKLYLTIETFKAHLDEHEPAQPVLDVHEWPENLCHQSLVLVTSDDGSHQLGVLPQDDMVIVKIEETVCPDCGQKFVDENALKKHLNLFEDYRATCDLCKASFTNECALQTHVREKHAFNAETNEQTTEDFIFPCKLCNASFSSQNALRNHKLTQCQHMHACNLCDARFMGRSGLYLHKRRVHEGRRDFQCFVCQKKFALKSQLEIHLRVHTGERPFSCQECGSSFKAQSQLLVHKRTHTDDRPYQCNVCGKRLRLGYNLKLHMRTHTGEKPYICKICNRGFSQPGDCKKHMRVHETRISSASLYCSQCGCRFSNLTQLHNHTTSEHKECLDSKCSICSTPSWSTNLKAKSLKLPRDRILLHRSDVPDDDDEDL